MVAQSSVSSGAHSLKQNVSDSIIDALEKGHKMKKNNRKLQIEPDLLNIVSVNCRGVNNKHKSIENMLYEGEIDVLILQELNTSNLKNFKGYTNYTMYSKQKFHGVAIIVKNSLNSNTLRIPDESGLEAVHLRLGNTVPCINIIGVYLPVESRLTVDVIDENWKQVTDKVDHILSKNESVIVIGDYNRPWLAKRPSHGTKRVMEWLEEGNVQLLNDSTPTRIDPVSKAGSILDLGIVSKCLVDSVVSFQVDTERKMSPFSVQKQKGVITKKFSDHMSIILKLKVNIIRKVKNKNRVPYIDYNNKEGWLKLEEVSSRYAPEMINIIKSSNDITEIDSKLNRLDTILLAECFGVKYQKPTRNRNRLKKKSSKTIREMFIEQQEELFTLIDENIIGKDLNKQIFNLKNLITGPKVKKQEQMAINDPVTNKLITDPEEIKRISLEHNLKILTKNKPLPEHKDLIEEKNKRHEAMMDNTSGTPEWELDYHLYSKVVQKIKEKNKHMYKQFNKTGTPYKIAIFEFMKKTIHLEEIPEKYKFTELTQIWKGKGSQLSLNNMRFIHMRGWKPKLLEAIVTEKMKPSIVAATPKFQLGGMPGASASEHLVVLKSWMRQKEVKKENGIFCCYDMQKFFDKESLKDCMDTLNTRAGVDPKSYRLWYKLNEDTQIAVKTCVGLSDSATITDSIGQGSVGAALVSSLNIGVAIEDTFKGEPSTKIGKVKLNSLVFQDDISKLCDNLEQAREGCHKIDKTLESKLLSLNYDKSKCLIVGSTKFRKKTLKELDETPMTMGKGLIEHSQCEKYLGDFIHERGCKESISVTIKERMRKLRSKCNDIIQIAEAPIMGGLNKGNVAFRLFEAQIIPALIHNAESWISITKKHIKDLQIFQDNFIKRVLRLPKSNPNAILQHDTGMWPMEWRIKYKKLCFVSKIMQKPTNNICRQVLLNEFAFGYEGLATEVFRICDDLGLEFVVTNNILKSTIKNAVASRIINETREKMLSCKKTADRVTDIPEISPYLNSMGLPFSRVWIRYRSRSIAGVKANAKSSHVDLTCRFCASGTEENQEHLEQCSGLEFERRGLDMKTRLGLVSFWRRTSLKIAAEPSCGHHVERLIGKSSFLSKSPCDLADLT